LSKENYKKNQNFIADYKKNYHLQNRQDIYREKHREKIAERSRKYGALNKDKVNSLKAKRRARKLNATPKWLTVYDFIQIQELYEIAQAFKLYTGQEYHVDHIIPLQGKDICGLHVPWNLQVILASENLRKSNKLLDN